MRSKKDTIHTKAERHILEAVKVKKWAWFGMVWWVCHILEKWAWCGMVSWKSGRGVAWYLGKVGVVWHGMVGMSL